MIRTTESLPSPSLSGALLFFGILAFVSGEILALGGVFTALVAIYPPFAGFELGLSLLAVSAGALLAALGGVLMPYASDCLHDPQHACRRRALTGLAGSLRLVLAMNGALLGPAGAICAFAALFVESFDLYMIILLLVAGAVGIISLRKLSAASEQMVSGTA